MNYHIGFAKGQKNAVIIKQEGYEDKEYTLPELNLHYNALMAAMGTPKEDPERLELMDIALNMMLKYQTDEEDVEEATEEVMDYDV